MITSSKNFKPTLIYILIAVVFSFGACKSNSLKSKKTVTVKGIINYHTPYCGGAHPSPEMAKGRTKPFANHTMFVVLKNSQNREVLTEFKTDDKGYFSVTLPARAYDVFGNHKKGSFENFVSKNSGGQFLVLKNEECLKEWYNTPEFSISLQKDTTIEFTYSSRCYKGLNPCLQYTGPLRP